MEEKYRVLDGESWVGSLLSRGLREGPQRAVKGRTEEGKFQVVGTALQRL